MVQRQGKAGAIIRYSTLVRDSEAVVVNAELAGRHPAEMLSADICCERLGNLQIIRIAAHELDGNRPIRFREGDVEGLACSDAEEVFVSQDRCSDATKTGADEEKRVEMHWQDWFRFAVNSLPGRVSVIAPRNEDGGEFAL